MTSLSRPRVEFISTILQTVLNLGLLCLGLILVVNLSHSGDDIALLLSDEGEVGCDIEVIRPRANWRWLANAVFSLGEHAEMDAVHPDQQLEMFWRIWTRKEAIVKQRGGSAWQIVSVDSTYHSSLSVSHCQLENLSLAICTPTPFTLTADSVQWIDSVN